MTDTVAFDSAATDPVANAAAARRAAAANPAAADAATIDSAATGSVAVDKVETVLRLSSPPVQSMIPLPELSIVVVAFNESPHVRHTLMDVLRGAAQLSADVEVIVVDDGSGDATMQDVEQTWEAYVEERGDALGEDGLRFVLLRHHRNRGMGAAIKTGVQAARAEAVTFLPADGQVPFEAIERMWRTWLHMPIDLLLTTYLRRNDGLHRKVLSFGVRAMIALSCGVWIESEGPYMFRRTLLDPKQFSQDTFFLNFAFPISAAQAKLRLANVCIPCVPRVGGHSKSANVRTVLRVFEDLVDFRVGQLRAKRLTWLGR